MRDSLTEAVEKVAQVVVGILFDRVINLIFVVIGEFMIACGSVVRLLDNWVRSGDGGHVPGWRLVSERWESSVVGNVGLLLLFVLLGKTFEEILEILVKLSIIFMGQTIENVIDIIEIFKQVNLA